MTDADPIQKTPLTGRFLEILSEADLNLFHVVKVAYSGSKSRVAMILDVIKTKRVLGFIFVVFSTRIYLAVFALSPQVDSDSGSYSSGNGFTNWNWVSFMGDGHSRGWPTVLIFSLVGDNSSKVLIQQMLSLTAWLFIGIVGALLFKEIKFQIFWLISVAIACLNPTSRKYDNWIGRESISLSLILISSSLLILYYRNRNRANIVSIALLSGILMIAKPTLLFISISILVLLFINVSNCNWRNLETIVSILFAIIIILYSLLNISNQNEGWGAADPTGRTTNEISFSYLISEFNPKSAELRSYLASIGAPACSTTKPPSVTNNLGAPMDYAAELHNGCKGFSEFIKTSFYQSYLRYIATHPGNSIEVISSQIGNVFDFNLKVSDLEFAISSSFFDKTARFLFDILFLVCLFYLSIFCLQVLTKYRRVRNSWLLVSILFLGLSCFASIIFSLLMQPTHPSDIARQNWVAASFMKYFIVALAITALQNQVRRGSLNVK